MLNSVSSLTQVLQDGTNTYLYGINRIAQYENGNPAYFLTDGLSSIRQLVDSDGTVTLTKSYLPYGDELSGSGMGVSSYGFTGEMYDSTGLIFLRARYYAPWDGRFTQKDPSRLEQNLYLYTGANPVNLIDPTGLFSIQEIAKSYGMSENELEGNLRYGLYDPDLKGRWGWIKLLLDAETGQSVSVGSPASFPPYLDTYGPDMIISDGCDNIIIGTKKLPEYTSDILEFPRQPVIWWRNTKPHHYFLDGQEYLDADRPRDLPDFRFVNIDVAMDFIPVLGNIVAAGFVGVIDRYGYVYAGVYGGLGATAGLPVTVGESYIAPYRSDIIPQIRGIGAIPEPDRTKAVITGACGNFTLGISFYPSASICQSGGYSMNYSYSIGFGGSMTISSIFGPFNKIDHLAWDYIDRKSGIDVHNGKWW